MKFFDFFCSFLYFFLFYSQQNLESYFADKCLCLKKFVIYLLQLEGSTETDRKAFGVFLIVLDVCFLVGTVASIAAVVYMLAQHTAEERNKGSAATTKILPSDEKVAPTTYTTITALEDAHTRSIPTAGDDGNSEHHQKVQNHDKGRKRSALKNKGFHMEL